MWIATQHGIVSIVKDLTSPGCLLVRGRTPESVRGFLGLPNSGPILYTPNNDYKFRLSMSKTVVANRVAAITNAIDYGNFKDSVADPDLHSLLIELWTVVKIWYEK